jgi:hypothetical protein
MNGRALTGSHKRAIVERIYAAWTTEGVNQLRLGQLVDNAVSAARGAAVFNVEDEALAIAVEQFVALHAK